MSESIRSTNFTISSGHALSFIFYHSIECPFLKLSHPPPQRSNITAPPTRPPQRLDYYCKHAITRFDLCTLMPQCKPWCLHFGGHGQLEDFGREFVDALPFHTSLTDQAANPSQVFDTVKPRDFLDMLYPHIFPRGPIELVVLNSCKGEGLARLLHEEAQVPYGRCVRVLEYFKYGLPVAPQPVSTRTSIVPPPRAPIPIPTSSHLPSSAHLPFHLRPRTHARTHALTPSAAVIYWKSAVVEANCVHFAQVSPINRVAMQYSKS